MRISLTKKKIVYIWLIFLSLNRFVKASGPESKNSFSVAHYPSQRVTMGISWRQKDRSVWDGRDRPLLFCLLIPREAKRVTKSGFSSFVWITKMSLTDAQELPHNR